MTQQCQIVTPLQLYFSWKAVFTNLQVRDNVPSPLLRVSQARLLVLAGVHELLLLRLAIAGLCVPHVLLVRNLAARLCELC